MNCEELFLRDVVAVDFYKTADCTFPMPFNVPNVTSISNVTLPAESVLHVGMSGADISMDSAATLKTSRSRKQAGFIYSHELSCTINEGVHDCDAKVAGLDGLEYVMVSTNASGEKHLHYPCPGTQNLSYEISNSGSTETGSLKVTISSMSGIISID